MRKPVVLDITNEVINNEDLEYILQTFSPHQWREAGWRLVDTAPACQSRGHGVVQVHVGLQIGVLCGTCGVVYLTGRIDERLARYAARRDSLKEAS